MRLETIDDYDELGYYLGKQDYIVFDNGVGLSLNSLLSGMLIILGVILVMVISNL
jgi:hypothetical protein